MLTKYPWAIQQIKKSYIAFPESDELNIENIDSLLITLV